MNSNDVSSRMKHQIWRINKRIQVFWRFDFSSPHQTLLKGKTKPLHQCGGLVFGDPSGFLSNTSVGGSLNASKSIL